MDLSAKILSDITVFTKYARHLPKLNRRETWEEICKRNMNMHIKKFPQLTQEITDVYEQFVMTKKVLPSMRSLQFGGKPIEISPNRLFNCCFLPVDDIRAFPEAMFLLLGGSGVGYSVQKAHVSHLPPIRKPIKKRRYLIGDSIEGWADSVKALLAAYMKGKAMPIFDFSDIREKGAPLITSGGKAPGPQPLKDCLHNIQKILDATPDGTQLSSIQAHDIMCYIADAVLAGGIRRAALISLFDMDDDDMLTCKFGNWWELNPQRGRANNSAVILRHKVKQEDFNKLWKKIEASGSGEPGLYFTNSADWGTNPCVEIALRPFQFCNLCEVNAHDIESQEEFNARAKAAAFIGTLQAAYTDFHYLRDIWRKTTEKDALIGVSMTGIASGAVFSLDETEAANCVKEENERIAAILGINPAARTTCIKPAGCQKPDTLIMTDRGLLKLNEIGDVNGVKWQAHDIKVAQEKDYHKSTKFYVNGFADTKKIKVSSGLTLECTPNHQYRVLRNHEYIWIRADELIVGDIIPYKLGGWNVQEEVILPAYERRVDKTSNGARKRDDGVTVNCHTLNADFAFLLGMLYGDGSVHEKGLRLNGSIKKLDVLLKAQQIVEDLFEIKTKIEYPKNRCTNANLYINSTALRRFLDQINCLKEKSYEVTIPKLIRMSPKHVVTAFIDGFIATDGCTKFKYEDSWSAATTSHMFAEQFVVLARAVELDCKFKELKVSDGHKGKRPVYQIQCRKARLNKDKYRFVTKKIRQVWTELDAMGLESFGFDVIQDIQDSQCMTYDIEVPENNCYIANSYVSHNTTSCVLGSSSGIHAWHDEHYIRRMRLGKNESLYYYLMINHPELVEDDFFKPNLQAILSLPIKAPQGAILRHESAIELLERVKRFSKNWVRPGHRKGDNTHNISATVSIKPEEWEQVGMWMWENREYYNGLSVLPYSNHTYVQAPFESCTKEEYEKALDKIRMVDLTRVIEMEDQTDLKGEVACSGGACEIV